MARINLRDFYPEYELDCYIEINDGDEETFIAEMTKEIADIYVEYQRAENAYERRTYYHKAHYSLNAGDGIENAAVNHSPAPEELFLRKLTQEQLYAALDALPEKQRTRIHQHYFLGISKAELARSEGLAENAVKDAIYRGLKNMEEFLKKYF